MIILLILLLHVVNCSLVTIIQVITQVSNIMLITNWFTISPPNPIYFSFYSVTGNKIVVAVFFVLHMNVYQLLLCTQESFSFENYHIWLEFCRALKTLPRGDERSACVSVSKWFGEWEQIIRPKQSVLRLLCLHCNSLVSGFYLRVALMWTIGWNALTRGVIWSCSRVQSLAWTPVSLLQNTCCTPGVESLQTESPLKRIQADIPELLCGVTQMCWVRTAGVRRCSLKIPSAPEDGKTWYFREGKNCCLKW